MRQWIGACKQEKSERVMARMVIKGLGKFNIKKAWVTWKTSLKIARKSRIKMEWTLKKVKNKGLNPALITWREKIALRMEVNPNT